MRSKIFIIVCCWWAMQSCQQQTSSSSFLHGVASGDPLAHSVVIWTRVTTDQPLAVVNWELSAKKDFSIVLTSGEFETSAERDFTVKIDVTDLDSDSEYFYRFKIGDQFSPIGKTKTAAQNADSLRFAVISCSNFEWGYFSSYGRLAEKPTLDGVLHLGDYIYEYAPGGYGDTTIGRKHEPAKELITLADYRTRYAQYRADKDLQAAHAAHPFICIWDDHEIANDTYVDGAQNHQEGEGDFQERKAAAKKAYYEWLPVRESSKLYRKMEFGGLADLLMMDERLEGRTKPAEGVNDSFLLDSSRSMLGEEQLNWFKTELSNSKKTWKIIGNQVVFSDLDRSAIYPQNPKNMDSWDGYPMEKQNIARFLLDSAIQNVVFVTGDTHESWAFQAVVKEVSENPVAIEFATPSLNSANSDEYSGLEKSLENEQKLLESNSHLKYLNAHDHGYLILTLTEDSAVARFYHVDTLREPNAPERLAKTAWVKSESKELLLR